MAETANIGSASRLPLGELNTYRDNPRRGDVDAIADSMRVNQVYKPLIVNRGTHTGRPNEVLAGNHSLMAMRTLAEENPDDARWRTADVWMVDVDEDRAKRIVLSDNRTSDLGDYDTKELTRLLDSIDDDLGGTGYNDDDVADLAALLEEEDDNATGLLRAVNDNVIDNYERQWPEPDNSVNHSPATADAPQDGPVTTTQANPGDQPDGLLTSNSDASLAERYADRATRMFVLSYPLEQYVWISEKFEQYASEHDDCGDNNAEIVLHMLANAVGEQPPVVEEDDQ